MAHGGLSWLLSERRGGCPHGAFCGCGVLKWVSEGGQRAEGVVWSVAGSEVLPGAAR